MAVAMAVVVAVAVTMVAVAIPVSLPVPRVGADVSTQSTIMPYQHAHKRPYENKKQMAPAR